jgi:hypothetical protein
MNVITTTTHKRYMNLMEAADLAGKATEIWIAEARDAIEREDWAGAEKAIAEATRSNENDKAWTAIARQSLGPSRLTR